MRDGSRALLHVVAVADRRPFTHFQVLEDVAYLPRTMKGDRSFSLLGANSRSTWAQLATARAPMTVAQCENLGPPSDRSRNMQLLRRRVVVRGLGRVRRYRPLERPGDGVEHPSTGSRRHVRRIRVIREVLLLVGLCDDLDSVGNLSGRSPHQPEGPRHPEPSSRRSWRHHLVLDRPRQEPRCCRQSS